MKKLITLSLVLTISGARIFASGAPISNVDDFAELLIGQQPSLAQEFSNALTVAPIKPNEVKTAEVVKATGCTGCNVKTKIENSAKQVKAAAAQATAFVKNMIMNATNHMVAHPYITSAVIAACGFAYAYKKGYVKQLIAKFKKQSEVTNQ